MRSNISSCEISGYFFCSLIACIVGGLENEIGLVERTEPEGGDAGRWSSWDGMVTEDVEVRHLAVGRGRGEGGGDDVRDA